MSDTPRTYEERAFDAENTVERLERDLAAMTAERDMYAEALREVAECPNLTGLGPRGIARAALGKEQT
jgi:hypothetical protein